MKGMGKFLLLALLAALFFHPADALAQQLDHQLIRRAAVFPVKVSAGLESTADETWWRVREELTRSRRFLVASKQFLIKSDVFQPRGDLEPADAVILGKLLDTHAMVTIQLLDRNLVMTVYDGTYGLQLWRRGVALHPSRTIREQLPGLGARLVNDFVASVPYQGFTIVDAMIGKPVYLEGDIRLAHVDFGAATGVQIGDTVQWIKLSATGISGMFQGAAQMAVFAEGKIVRLDEGVAIVEISRATSLKDIREYALVRVPREADRLRSEFVISDTPKPTLTAEVVTPEFNPMSQVTRERKPLTAALSFISALAAFLLLAF
jgi:hypothetical protein